MKVLTKELKGDALDWAVAKAKGWIDYPEDCVEAGRFWHTQPERAPFDPVVPKEVWRPAHNWEQGGPIIEQERISTAWTHDHWCGGPYPDKLWMAHIDTGSYPGAQAFGPTPLIAAMRCFVAGKLGDEIDVPEELL